MGSSTVNHEVDLSGVILAGGESKRMGRDKAWLEMDGQPLLALAAQKMRQLGLREIFISGRAGKDYSAFGLPVLLDREPGGGPLGGIERALQECTSPLLLVLAVDLPRLDAAWLQRLVDCCDGRTGALPQLNGRFEPLAAVYPKRSHALAAEALRQSRRAVRAFAEDCLRAQAVRVFEVTPRDASCFANWNSPEDADRTPE